MSPISTAISNGTPSPLPVYTSDVSQCYSQAMSETPDTPRRISQANAHRPPQHRRRVWRACETYRKKKVKCDGSDPCKPCLSYGIQCTYPGTTIQRGNEGESSDMFRDRLQSLEEMVAKLVEVQSNQIQQQQRESLPPPMIQDQQPALEALHPHTEPPAEIMNIEPLQLDELYSPNLQDLLLSSAIDPSFWPRVPQPVHIQTYADCFGQLEVDKNGDTRYVGLGATVCIVDNCAGLRKRIQNGLANKGYDPQESVLDSSVTSPAVNAPSPIGWWAGELPPAGLTDALVDKYFAHIHRLFPIISELDFRHHAQHLLAQKEGCATGTTQDESLSLFYAVLAVTSPQLSPTDPVYTLSDCWRYQGIDLGAHFFSLAVSSIRSLPASLTGSPTAALDSDSAQRPSRTSVLNTVIARALLSIHLTQTGMPREAWKMLSHAVRLGQDMGLHRSPCKFHLPSEQQTMRRRVWWCLYVMDRLLSMNLGRPLAIEDADCDVEIPSPTETTSSFIAMIHLCHIIGRVLRISNSVGNAARWRDPANHAELRATVDRFTAQLEEWEREHIGAVATDTTDSTTDVQHIERSVLQSSYFATVILLFRPLMSNPHRPSPLGTQRAMRRCFEASMACISLTEGYVRVAMLSHYLVLHGQTLFICVILLMHCIRLTENEETLRDAVEGCQRGIASLTGLEGVWCAARQCRAIAEEYLEFTLDVLERGNRGSCSFEHEQDAPQAASVHPVLGALKRTIEHSAGDGEPKRRRGETAPVSASPFPSISSSRPCSFMVRTQTRR
ncbi:fungal-specific transcription factor domain-containing protein [Aspergillus floccosus]